MKLSSKLLGTIFIGTIVIIITAFASVDTAVQAMKLGAFDYITKPVDPDKLSHLVRRALEQRRLNRENLQLRETIDELGDVDTIVGESAPMKHVMELVRNELGLPIVERPIDRTVTTICDEFFMTGTAAQVVAVTKVDYRPIGTGAMGPVVSKLRDLFEDVVRGRSKKYSQWITEI